MDDRTWYLGVGILGAAVLAQLLDAALTSFNVDPTFYPFLGVFAGAVFGIGVTTRRRRNGKHDTDERDR